MAKALRTEEPRYFSATAHPRSRVLAARVGSSGMHVLFGMLCNCCTGMSPQSTELPFLALWVSLSIHETRQSSHTSPDVQHSSQSCTKPGVV